MLTLLTCCACCTTLFCSLFLICRANSSTEPILPIWRHNLTGSWSFLSLILLMTIVLIWMWLQLTSFSEVCFCSRRDVNSTLRSLILSLRSVIWRCLRSSSPWRSSTSYSSCFIRSWLSLYWKGFLLNYIVACQGGGVSNEPPDL